MPCKKKPAPERPVTRAKNADKHPGQVDQKRKRRTKAEIENANAVLQKEKDEKVRKQKEGITKIAQLENQMAIDDASTESAHPRNSKDVNGGHGYENRSTDRNEFLSGNNMPMVERLTQPVNKKPIQGSIETKQKGVRSDNQSKTGTGALEDGDSGNDGEQVISAKTISLKKGVGAKQGVSVQRKIELAYAPSQRRPSTDESSQLTEPEVTPKNIGRGLRRSYAMVDLRTSTQVARSKHKQQSSEDEYKPGSEPATATEDGGMATETELNANTVTETELDDDVTPMKKQKVAKKKVPVREAIEANRRAYEAYREKNKPCDDDCIDDQEPMCVLVCFGMELLLNDTTLFYYNISATKTSKTKYGPVTVWAAKVAKAHESERVASLSRSASSITAVSANRTTSLSNAVVIPSKRKHVKSGFNNKTISHGFLEGEDEGEEREAALSSPVKGPGQRLSNSGIIKLEHTTPPPPTATRMAGHKKKYTNINLPNGYQDNNAWRGIFIPTYLQYLATRDVKDVWAISDKEAVSVLQKIWNYTYGNKITHTVTRKGPVFAVTDQRVCEWRSGFASAALSILHAFFDDNDFDSDDSRQEFAKSSLQGLSFLFRDVYTNRKGDIVRKGVFGGPLVVQTFTTHLSAIQDAASVPGVGDPASRPSIALALSAAAVERALTLWADGLVSCETVAAHRAKKRSSAIMRTINMATGKKSTKATDFTHTNWGTKLNSYLSSVKQNLSSANAFDIIINEAKSYLKGGPGQLEDSVTTVTNGQELDERALICDDNSDYDDASDLGSNSENSD